MKNDSVKLYDLVASNDPEAVFTEISHILSLMNAADVEKTLRQVYDDIIRLFYGNYPGYRASNTKYHNLEHTTMVTLACARLIHGCTEGGYVFDKTNILLGLLAALYHDSGLIQKDYDRKGTGAKYTIGHEERSIEFMRKNLSELKLPEDVMEDCADLIKCTNLDQEIAKISFRSGQLEILGKIVGSSDLLAQMADRNYLEKLVLLFKEFEEAGIPEFDSEVELLRKTEGFYKNVARKRLVDEMDNVSANMAYHFKVRWGIEKDLYQESIENNLKFLNQIFGDGGNGNMDDRMYRQYLKREGIISKTKKNPEEE